MEVKNNNRYIDEGYIKFTINWIKDEPIDGELIKEVNAWRNTMYELGFIGFYKEAKVGYGNISVKNSGEIVISGTQTGHLPILTNQHYTVIKEYNVAANTLTCKGPIKASSESLTHAAVYELNPKYQAVIHIHHKKMWEELLYKIPTTAKNIPYGTPEMAYEIKRLFETTALKKGKFLAMAGHDEGLIAFGKNLDEAGAVIKYYAEQINV